MSPCLVGAQRLFDLSGFPPDRFGDYKSFLEIGFALNALFGAWQVLPEALSRRRRAARLANVGKYAEELSQEAYDRVDNISVGVVWCGRTFGLLTALLIAAGLFAIPDDATVATGGAVIIAAACMPVPLAILATYLVDLGFLAVLSARKSRAWLKYWWFVLRTLHRVGKADEIRALWKKRREQEKDSLGDVRKSED